MDALPCRPCQVVVVVIALSSQDHKRKRAPIDDYWHCIHRVRAFG
jgi:hypothetical protein